MSLLISFPNFYGSSPWLRAWRAPPSAAPVLWPPAASAAAAAHDAAPQAADAAGDRRQGAAEGLRSASGHSWKWGKTTTFPQENGVVTWVYHANY